MGAAQTQKRMTMKDERILSSLPLQLLLFLDGFYFVGYSLVTLGLLLYKLAILPYPSAGIFVAEVMALVLMNFVQWMRLPMGSSGNKTERSGPMVLFILMCISQLFGYLYFLLWQSYVMLLDFGLSIAGLVLIGLQLLIGLWTTVTFMSNNA